MEPKNVILWVLLVVLAVLAMSTGVQAQELRGVFASEILEKIRAWEDAHLENVWFDHLACELHALQD